MAKRFSIEKVYTARRYRMPEEGIPENFPRPIENFEE